MGVSLFLNVEVGVFIFAISLIRKCFVHISCEYIYLSAKRGKKKDNDVIVWWCDRQREIEEKWSVK